MQIAISLLGGLGLFLYGMNMMGDGLQKSAGEQLKKIIGFLTSNVVMGVLVGAVVTGIIQSSSATTVMVVGFVNAGIMSLSQAIGLIMGVERIIDMFRTTVNVMGDNICTLIVANSENDFDKDMFYGEKEEQLA